MLKNKKLIIKIILIILILISISILVTEYIINEEIREIIDKYILGKEIEEENTNIINLEKENNNYVYAFADKIVILSGNILKIYNSSGKEIRKFRDFYF